MNDPDRIAREAALQKLITSREELRVLFEPPDPAASPNGSGGAAAFPRSRTMQLLMSGKGLGTVGALVGGLIAARPAMALRVLRLVPVTAVGKLLLAKGLGLMRQRYTQHR